MTQSSFLPNICTGCGAPLSSQAPLTVQTPNGMLGFCQFCFHRSASITNGVWYYTAGSGAIVAFNQLGMSPGEELEMCFGTKPLVGWRAFDLWIGGSLGSVATNYLWQSGKNEAKCKTTRMHEAPSPHCACGFWAYKEKAYLRKHLPEYEGCLVYAKVEMWGKVIEHELGYRSQYARILEPVYCAEASERARCAMTKKYSLEASTQENLLDGRPAAHGWTGQITAAHLSMIQSIESLHRRRGHMLLFLLGLAGLLWSLSLYFLSRR